MTQLQLLVDPTGVSDPGIDSGIAVTKRGSGGAIAEERAG